MVRDLPQSAGGILSYFTRHKTLANLLLVVLLMNSALLNRVGKLSSLSMLRLSSQYFSLPKP